MFVPAGPSLFAPPVSPPPPLRSTEKVHPREQRREGPVHVADAYSRYYCQRRLRGDSREPRARAVLRRPRQHGGGQGRGRAQVRRRAQLPRRAGRRLWRRGARRHRRGPERPGRAHLHEWCVPLRAAVPRPLSRQPTRHPPPSPPLRHHRAAQGGHALARELLRQRAEHRDRPAGRAQHLVVGRVVGVPSVGARLRADVRAARRHGRGRVGRAGRGRDDGGGEPRRGEADVALLRADPFQTHLRRPPDQGRAGQSRAVSVSLRSPPSPSKKTKLRPARHPRTPPPQGIALEASARQKRNGRRRRPPRAHVGARAHPVRARPQVCRVRQDRPVEDPRAVRREPEEGLCRRRRHAGRGDEIYE